MHTSYLDYLYVNRDVSYNTLGQTGLIMTPSAETEIQAYISQQPEMKFGKLEHLQLHHLTGLNQAIFIIDPVTLYGVVKLYLDKSQCKIFALKKFNNKIAFAIGLDDFAGTGVFSKEYLATTYSGDNFKINLGIGFGMFTSENSFKNHFLS